MEESVIFNSPGLLLLYCLALIILALAFIIKSRYFFPVLSLLIAVGTTAYALLLGSTLWEAATVMMAFLLIHMVFYRGGRE